MSLFFFGKNFYKNKETYNIFSPQILDVYRILLVETTLESMMFYYTFSVINTMFVPCTALLYDSTAATRILELSTTLLSISCGIRLFSFLMMSSPVCGLLSQTLSFRYHLRKIVRWVEILGIGWPRVVGLTRNESVSWKVMPEVFKCSISESVLVAPHFSNKTLEYLRYTFPWGRLISHQTDNPWPSYSHYLNPPDYSLRGYLKDQVCKNNLQTGENRIEEKSDEFPKKCSIELWIILMF